MGWRIEVIKNEVLIPKRCRQELYAAQSFEGEIWEDIEDIVWNGKLRFNDDHKEHMDFLGVNRKLIDILCKHRVEGDICFGSLEGDNAGQYWGYRFLGKKASMVRLEGVVTFKEVASPFIGKTVVLTGRLPSYTRAQAEALIRQAGGKPSSTVTAKTDYVVVGADPGSKLSKAKLLRRKIIDEVDFRQLLGN